MFSEFVLYDQNRTVNEEIGRESFVLPDEILGEQTAIDFKNVKLCFEFLSFSFHCFRLLHFVATSEAVFIFEMH